MLLDPAHARFEIADEHAVTDDRGVKSTTARLKPDDLVGQFLARREQVGGDVGAQGADVDFSSERSEPSSDLLASSARKSARNASRSVLVTASARIWRRIWRIRLSGSVRHGCDP